MNLQRCKNGHFYDGDKFIDCHYCGETPINYLKEIKSSKSWKYINKIKSQLLKIDHGNIVKIYNIFSEFNRNYIKEQYISGATIDMFIRNNNICFEDFLRIGIDVCHALNYLEKNSIVHMDIKPSNIMYNSFIKKATLIDIEMVYCEESGKIDYYGTIEYSAPEQLLHSEYSVKASVYSLGLTFYKMINGKLPFNISKAGVLKKVNEDLDLEFDNLDDFKYKSEVINLIKKMVCNNKNARIKTTDILKILNDILKKVNTNDLSYRFQYKDFSLITSDNISQSQFTEDQTFGFEKTEQTLSPKFTDIISPLLSLSEEKKAFDVTYREELLKEYRNILNQAKISFWCWISALVMCYIIIILCIYLILNGRFFDSAISVLLEGLAFAVQKIFSIREDHYRELINNKIAHLQKGDFLEYAVSTAGTLKDENKKQEKLSDIIDDIRKMSKTDDLKGL